MPIEDKETLRGAAEREAQRAREDGRYHDAIKADHRSRFLEIMALLEKGNVEWDPPLKTVDELVHAAKQVLEMPLERLSFETLMAAKTVKAWADFEAAWSTVHTALAGNEADVLIDHLAQVALLAQQLGAYVTWVQLLNDGTVQAGVAALKDKAEQRARALTTISIRNTRQSELLREAVIQAALLTPHGKLPSTATRKTVIGALHAAHPHLREIERKKSGNGRKLGPSSESLLRAAREEDRYAALYQRVSDLVHGVAEPTTDEAALMAEISSLRARATGH